MVARWIALALLLAGSGLAAPCPLRHTVAPGDTLPDLAAFYLGSQDFAPAIFMATNSRFSDGFARISNPDTLRPGPLCIPDLTEAQRARAQYAIYQKAVAEMSTTHPWEVADRELVRITPGETVTVASWTYLGKFKIGNMSMADDTWVTVEPHLKDFCSKFAREHNDNRDQLTLRLEQRLGLPPAAGYTTIARIRLENPTPKTVFRPCSDPEISEAKCQAGAPPETAGEAWKAWFTGQYYSAYGSPGPTLYPWTALGYTFDWAQRPGGEFQRVGESEFVIPKHTPIDVIAIVSTAEYCSN